MAMFICEICQNLTDGDYNVPTEYYGGLICEYCATEFIVIPEPPETENEG